MTSESVASVVSKQPVTRLTEIDRLRLLAAIRQYFDEGELRTLCFGLDVDYDELPGRSKADKARELILLCERTYRLDALIAICQQQRPLVNWPAFIRVSQDEAAPFKGLAYYDMADAHLFFGREALTAELVNHLHHHRFLAVIGASGSGKSSLVRAGLLPALQGRLPTGVAVDLPRNGASWPLFVLTLTAQPLTQLATSLTQDTESVRAAIQLMDDMAQDSRSLDIALRRLANQHQSERVLLFIDQFEELFTLCRDESERKALVDNLATAVALDTAGPATIIIALRADYYGHCLQYNNLRPLLEQQQKTIGPMTGVELRQAIEMPAQRHGLQFEPGLVELLLRDVGLTGDQPAEPGVLPLLSHALLETWQRREGHHLTLAGYHAAGGVRGAVAKTADTTYRQLGADQQTIARNIFLRLTALSEGLQDSRRRASLSELIPQHDNALAVVEILKLLVDARLLTTHQETAEVAHEALIREWPTLRRWLDENREELRRHRRLTEAAQIWDSRGRDESYLYRGTRLETARQLTANGITSLSSLEQIFLDESQRAQIRQRQEEREKQQRAQRSTLGAAIGGALGAGLSFWLAYRDLVTYAQTLWFITLIATFLGAVAGFLLFLLLEMALNAPMDEKDKQWRAWILPTLAGIPGPGLLLTVHTLIFVTAPLGMLLPGLQGAVWGAGIGLGLAWLKRSQRPLWLTLLLLAVAWALLLLLGNQVGNAFSLDGNTAAAPVVALAGAIVPLAMWGGAELAANGLAGRWRQTDSGGA